MARILLSSLVTLLAIACWFGSTGTAAKKNAQTDAIPASRTFRLHYGSTLEELPEGARIRVWLPVPSSSEHQEIEEIESALPAEAQTTVEPLYGNKILYFETEAPVSRKLAFDTSYLVRRREVRGLTDADGRKNLTDDQRRLFLSANRKVPLAGKQLALLDGVRLSRDPLAAARALYDRVDDHVAYDKSKSGYGHGDVLWVCDSRTGNCTDFHSLFISLSRARGMPARFEIGFPLPPERGEGTIGGYHCWALFHTEAQGWVPVDISEADKNPAMKEYYFGNLTENRVAFTTGRDLDLVPKQDGGPVNFFVYPYVEVEGKVWPAEKSRHRFTFQDLAP